MTAAIRVKKEILACLLGEARRLPGEECCGLLAGREGVITAIYSATNALASANAYEIAPEELFRLIRAMRAAGVEMLGIYHSHPLGENRPSSRDIERAYYPNAAYFLISPLPDVRQPVRAFSIRNGCATELAINLV